MEHTTSTLIAALPYAARPSTRGTLAARAASTSAIFAARAAMASDATDELARLRADTYAQLSAS